MSTLLQQRNDLPPGFLSSDAPGLARLLGGPTLIHLDGDRPRPLFAAILLHGNETTGLAATQALLRRYRNARLPRALCLFVANTAAAALGVRHLSGQPDWNRIWPVTGLAPPAPAEAVLAARVRDCVAVMQPFAVVDVHNNNGYNPHYACINCLDPAFLQLAKRFSRRVLYFTIPPGTLTQSFAELAPAVTLECGPVGEAAGAAHAADFLDACLRLDAIPSAPVANDDIALYRSVARITVPTGVSVGVGDTRDALRLPVNLEAMNWRPQPIGTVLAHTSAANRCQVLEIQASIAAEDVAGWLRHNGDRIELARPGTPAMLTVDTDIVTQDCFGYLLEPLPLTSARADDC